MFRYAFKRVIRGYRLFAALTIGVLIATTFFASMIVSADVLSREALTSALAEIDYDARINANNMTWTNTQTQELDELLEELPEVSIADRYSRLSFTLNETLGQSFNLMGIQSDSTVWNTLQYVNGSTALDINETWVIASSVNASVFDIGDVIEIPIRYRTAQFPFIETVALNVTVAGFVDIPERTARLLNPPRVLDLGFISIEIGDWREYSLLAADWELTFRPIVDWFSEQENATQLGINQGFLCQLNREALVNPYDLGASSTNIANAIAKIEDRTVAYNTQVTNLVGSTLSFLSLTSGILVLAFVSLAAPVIFMSWYSSTMLSDVSYNLRRREFGLLQTKGFPPKVIKRMLVFEGLIIGLVGGVAGLLLGTILAHVIVDVAISNLLLAATGNWINVVVVIGFGLLISYWSVRGPADRASKLEPLDSLKQYVYVEEQREYKKLLPTIALILGTYKIVVWVLGINMQTLLAAAAGSGFVVVIAIALWTPIDAFLNFAGPIMFLYGITKMLLRGSQKFQQYVVEAGRRFFGAFGNLATRNVRRNPVRNAALVFVVSLIVSYGLFSVGSLFSEQDRLNRTNLYEIGSDVGAVFNAGANISDDIEAIQSLDGIQAATIEYHISMSSTRGTLQTRGIWPSNWTEAAFYEQNWFSGGTVEDILQDFTGEKIILSIAVARQLELRIGNQISLRAPDTGTFYQMEIVGLIGYVSPLEDLLGQFAFSGNYPSYVPAEFLEDVGLLEYAESHVLLRTLEGINGTSIKEQIRQIAPSVASTDSLTSRTGQSSENLFQLGGTRARWVGVAFGAVLAIVGTGLVVGLTLKEKEYEVTLLAVRGFTKKQVLKVLIAEVMVMILFSLVLGVGAGFVQLFGDIANTTQNSQTLVVPRVVLTPVSVLSMMAIAMAVVLSAIVPVVWATRFNEQKVDVLRE
jgi:hypothetical protein